MFPKEISVVRSLIEFAVERVAATFDDQAVVDDALDLIAESFIKLRQVLRKCRCRDQ